MMMTKKLVESIEMLSKNMNMRSSSGVPQRVPGFSQNNRNNNPPRKFKAAESTPDFKNKRSGTQCHECDSFGHIKSECANTLKKNNKFFNTTWSDGDSDGSNEEEYHVSHHIALTTRSGAEKSSYEE